LDQYYYEEGYIDARYHVYVAVAEGLIAPYFENGYLEEYYFQNEGAWASLTFEGDIVNIIVEASGSWTSEFTQVSSAGIIKVFDSSQSAEFSQSSIVDRIRLADSSMSVSATQNSLIGKIHQVSADFTDAFTPTLIADAFKNHTAVIDAQASMAVDVVVNRSGNVLLEHIANLNAMAIKDVVSSATFSTTSSLSTQPNVIKNTESSLSVVSALSSNSGKLKTASTNLDNRFTVFTSRYLGWIRPNVQWTGTLNYVYEGEPLGDFNFGAAKYGTYSARSGFAYAQRSTNVSNPDWDIEANEPFALEFHVRRTDNTNRSTTAGGQPCVFMGSLTNYHYWSDESTANTAWSIGLFYIASGQQAGFTHWRFRYNNGSSLVNIDGSQLSNFNNLVNLWEEDTWYHIAVNRGVDGIIRLYTNGQQVGSSSYSGAIKNSSGANRIGVYPSHITSNSTGQYTGFFDELVYKVGSSDVSTGGTVGTNDAYIPYQQLLVHFENELVDDRKINHLGQAAVSANTTLSISANANTKLAAADLSAATVLTAEILNIKQLDIDVSSQCQLDINAGKLKGITEDLTATVTTDQTALRIRPGQSTQNALFTPTITVRATKIGEIVLQSQFTATIDATSFTEGPAALASEFTVAAEVDGIARITSASLSTDTSVSAVIGTQESAIVSISGAFNATVSVQYFEGTSLIAPMTAVMAVTAQKTARITKTLTSALTLSADVRENAQAPAANPIYTTYQERVDVNVSYSYTYNRVSGTNRRSFYFQTDPAGIIASSLFPNGSLAFNNAEASINFYVYEYGQSGQQDWYDTKFYSFNIGVVDSVSTGAATFVNGSGSIRIVLDVATENYLTVYLDGSATPLTLSGPNSISTTGRIYWPTFEPFPISNQNGRFGWPPALFPSANSVVDLNSFGDIISSSATDLAYTPYYGPQEYAVADLVDYDFASLSASVITVVFLNVSLIAGTFAQTATVARIRGTTATLSTSSTVYANAGKAAVASVTVNAASTVQASVSRTRLAETSMSVDCITTCAPTRVRYHAADITSAVTQTTQAVKQTGNVIAVESTAAQTTQGQRIRYAGADFSAFNSTVTVAAKNATGTITLESEFTQVTDAVKDAQGVIALNSQCEITANTAQGKIVGFAATLASAVTQDTIGDRIQPAGSDMLSEFTQSTNSNDSKITRIVTAITSTATMTVSADRSRAVIALQASAGTLTCQNDTIRFGSAQITDAFNILASPTFIVRITADFLAFNSQLTVGEVINIDPYLTLWIKPESRTYEITAETRIITILQETRVNIIEGYSQ
jgi:hypothetical protein